MILRSSVAIALLSTACASRGCTATPARPDAVVRAPSPTPPHPLVDPVATVGQALLDLESQLSWPDGGAPLTGGREAWTNAVRQSRSPQALAATVLQLEEAIGADGMTEGWAAGREAWRSSLSAPTPATLARAVRQLGESVREPRATPGWAEKRSSWLQRLDAVR